MGGSSLCYVTTLISLVTITDKSCDHKHCDCGDICGDCHVTFRELMFKGLYEFMGRSPSQ